MEWMRDPIWQFIGVLVAVVALIVSVVSEPLQTWLKSKLSFQIDDFWQKYKPHRTNNNQYRVSVAEACRQLQGLTLSSRVNAINDIAPNLPNQITGQEAAGLLGTLRGSSRVEAIKILATKILPPQSEKEVDNLLAGLTGTSRKQAIQELRVLVAKQGKCPTYKCAYPCYN